MDSDIDSNKLRTTQFGKNLASSRLWFWAIPMPSQVLVRNKLGDFTTWNFQPTVYIERITLEYIKNRAQAIGTLFQDSSDTAMAKSSEKDVAKALDVAISHAEKGGIGQQNPAVDPAKPAVGPGNSDVTVQSVLDRVKEPTAETDEILSVLDMLSAPDLGSFVLVDSTFGGVLQASEFEGASYHVISAQKKGNVLYVHQEVTFSKTYQPDKKTPADPLRVGEDLFFFSVRPESFRVI